MTKKNPTKETIFEPTKAPSKFATACALGMLVLFSWVLNYNKIQSNDVWHHLEMGKYIYETKTFITQDIYGAITSGKKYIAHEWLAEVIFYLTANDSGSTLTYLKLGLVLFSTIVFGGILIKPFMHLFITLPASIILLYLFAFRAHVRPHLFGNICLLAFITWLQSVRRKPTSWYIWLAIPLQIIWTNLHGSYLFGPVFLGLYVATEWFARMNTPFKSWNKDDLLPLNTLKKLTYMIGFLVLAILINPYGYHLIVQIFEVFTSHNYMREHIKEWVSITGQDFGSYWVTAWVVFMGATWISLLMNRAKFSLADLSMLLVATYMPFTGMRYVAISSMIAFPLLLRNGHTLSRISPKPRLIVLILLPLIFYVAKWGTPYSSQEHKPVGVGYNLNQVPTDVIEFIKSNNLSGSIMTHYQDGSYVIFYLTPKVKAVIDSRTDLYGEELYNEHRLAFYTLQNFKKYLAKYKVDMVLMQSIPNYDVLRADLIQSPDWELAYIGFSHALFTKKSAKKTEVAVTPAAIPPPKIPITTSPQTAKASSAAHESNDSYCLVGRALNHCKTLSKCETICALSDPDFEQKLSPTKPWCAKFLRTCSDKATACTNCPEVCNDYRTVISQLNKDLGFAYPPAPTCN